MKKVLFAAITVACFSSAPALAADLPTKGYAPAAAPLFNWSGLYIGGSVGWIGNHYDWAFEPAIAGAANQSWNMSQNNVIGGGHIGLQGQFGQWVLGVELAGSGLFRSGGFNDWAKHDGFGLGAAGRGVATVGELWQAGARIGWTPNNNWLWYVTGGYARGLVQTNDVLIATGVAVGNQQTGRIQQGWYLGGGFEYMFARNWIAGIEYQRIDLGSKIHCPQLALASCSTNTNTRRISNDDDVVRFRLSYLFGPR